MIVPTEQMSLAIGKEGQNARLAFKLTGWRIDIKDPEAMRDQGLEMFRQVQSQIAEAAGRLRLAGPPTATGASRRHDLRARPGIRSVRSVD